MTTLKMPVPPDPFSSRGFGASAPWLDLVNSELYDGFGNFTECLDDSRWLRSFLHYWKLHIPQGDPAALLALRDFRALLRHLVEKSAAQGALDSADLAKLNAWLKVPVFPKLVESQSGLTVSLQPAQTGWPSEVAVIARSFADSLMNERKGHLKICANQDCRWIFIDRTKGNVRRWCSDATCGNRDRVRRSRSRNL
jgi:predicted RNA-binding Zn ribbon-like protein